MKKFTGVIVGGTLLLSGCASSEADEPVASPTLPSVQTTEPSTAAPTTTEAPKTAERNERGSIVKTLGETGGMLDDAGNELVTFAVDSITPDIACNGDSAEPAEKG